MGAMHGTDLRLFAKKWHGTNGTVVSKLLRMSGLCKAVANVACRQCLGNLADWLGRLPMVRHVAQARSIGVNRL